MSKRLFDPNTWQRKTYRSLPSVAIAVRQMSWKLLRSHCSATMRAAEAHDAPGKHSQQQRQRQGCHRGDPERPFLFFRFPFHFLAFIDNNNNAPETHTEYSSTPGHTFAANGTHFNELLSTCLVWLPKRWWLVFVGLRKQQRADTQGWAVEAGKQEI